MPSKLSLQSACLLALGATVSCSPAVSKGPCDIYASGGTACVAAHSTTRALFGSYNGPLYQVTRASDGKTSEIYPKQTGGVANAAAQDSFCSGTTCHISVIFDQTESGNKLTAAPPGGAARGSGPNGYDTLSIANMAPVKLNGQKVYGVYVSPGIGYRNNQAKKTATGTEPEGMYAVLNGQHYNGKCCFDYGNAESNSRDNGNGHMEAINFGTDGYGGAGNGPWIGADLENGVYTSSSTSKNPNSPTIQFRFVTALLKGKPGNFALRGGNSASGGLNTYYNGARPANGYDPMHLEGAIILGTGGDNSDGSEGTFYEGVMTSGYPSDATENAVQANIVAAKYTT